MNPILINIVGVLYCGQFVMSLYYRHYVYALVWLCYGISTFALGHLEGK